MKIISQTSNLDNIDSQAIIASIEGKCYQRQRVYVLKTSNGYTALSLNLFERIGAFFYRLVNQDYFAKKLKDQNVKVLSHDPLLPIREQNRSVEKIMSLYYQGNGCLTSMMKKIDMRSKEVERDLVKMQKFLAFLNRTTQLLDKQIAVNKQIAIDTSLDSQKIELPSQRLTKRMSEENKKLKALEIKLTEQIKNLNLTLFEIEPTKNLT